MVDAKLVVLASLATITSNTVGADGLHSSLSFPQCTNAKLSSNSAGPRNQFTPADRVSTQKLTQATFMGPNASLTRFN